MHPQVCIVTIYCVAEGCNLLKALLQLLAASQVYSYLCATSTKPSVGSLCCESAPSGWFLGAVK